MRFIRNMISRKRVTEQEEDATVEDFHDTLTGAEESDDLTDDASGDVPETKTASAEISDTVTAEQPVEADDQTDAIFEKITAQLDDDTAIASAATATPVNIWDMEDEGAIDAPAASPVVSAAKAPLPSAIAGRASSLQRRTKTRLIGFEKSTGDIVDLFDAASRAPVAERAKFPVGWIVVADGPGRGESFSLFTGMSQIGRGEDQAIQLDFGDSSISRSNHAAIVYDADSKVFLIGHGGKTNIVRLNGKPLISNEELTTGDRIRIGETTLRFVALCGEDFHWDGDDAKENEDVAIA